MFGVLEQIRRLGVFDEHRDLERFKVKEQGNRQKSFFPWFQIWLIFGLMFGLMALVLAAAHQVTEVGFIYDGLPAVALFVLIVGASLFSWRLGLARIDEAQNSLS
ncbi:hypothetical protein [uncultured Roseobacter sp.]|uniref:hypothetical protein n=1 Tax=uncultured Roseobacter sp. TaxID=114847 RepID=UPI0026341068|nr:hypothetical protein [uncultured Roseobacter sp.]